MDARQPLPFYRDMAFEYGVLEQLAPGIRRFVCNNPGPFTFKGTNTYVLGEGSVAVVDPGPEDGAHSNLLNEALSGERITHILITHCHSDHSGAAAWLKERTGAELCGMPRQANDPALRALCPAGRNSITPVIFDRPLSQGDRVTGDGWEVEAIHTPGHAPDHLCFHLPHHNTLLCGDHVMGWNTTVVAPPEGHMGSYLRSLDLLMTREETVYYPGHGGPVTEPQRFIKALMLHRRWRESEITECLRSGLRTIEQLVAKIYAGLDPSLSRAAGLAVLAQLEFMLEKGLIRTGKPGGLALDQEFVLSEQKA